MTIAKRLSAIWYLHIWLFLSIKLFKLKDDFILPRYMKQLSQYEREHNFTYSGMLKALKYWYEVKHNPVDTDRGVGIIPYIYA